jgi:hypothetical protein
MGLNHRNGSVSRRRAAISALPFFLGAAAAVHADCLGGHDIRQWHTILEAAFQNDEAHQWTISVPLCKIMLLAPDERSIRGEVAEACRQATTMQWNHTWLVVGYLANSEIMQTHQPQCEVR